MKSVIVFLVLIVCAFAADTAPDAPSTAAAKSGIATTTTTKATAAPSTTTTPTTTTTSRTKEIVPIISQENVMEGDGKYRYNYESGDGTKSNQEGELKHVDPENAGEAVKGQFSYTGRDGQTYSVEYTADENGYVPKGAHIPTPPPIPPQIARALAYLATLPPSTEAPIKVKTSTNTEKS